MQTAEAPSLKNTPDVGQVVKTLSRVSTRTALYHLAEIWLMVAAAIYLSAVLFPLTSGIIGILVYLFSVPIVASRQHALTVLVHEGIHKRLSRTLWMNDWLARLTAGCPVFISLAKWRYIHLAHHQYTNTPDDPDRAIYARYPLASKQFFGLLVRDVCGLNVISTLKYFIDVPLLTSAFNRRFLGEVREAQYRQAADMWVFYLFWSVVGIGGLWLFGSQAAVLFLLYWLVPYCTWTQVFFRIRGAIEHGNVPDPHNSYQQTRTYFIPAWLGFFFAPKHVNYHLEHHLYPSIPFYNLPRMHAVLKRGVYPRESGYCEPFGVSLQKLAEG